ncbi:MAG: prepilin-type N-terminal cleavage/methylation domain-containing protein [Thermosynechococcus sp.]|uniref:PilW family protein n=1 Tax=Thermosynechococcus sp. TaxID=2814275 RepID=UPI0021FD746D|nr:type II secretion system protein [Thermosynechococcus sp.]BCX12454.1 MAG: prepilin-type N-terminal cleavage/methylation domain-containing protein [Thermosynechococcus sp.]
MKWPTWRWRRSRGFTLVEILVSLVIAGILMSALGAILIDMLDTERREASLNQLRQDLKAAMDVISNDLAQAVFVYNGNCLAGNDNSNPKPKDLCGDTTRPTSQRLTNYLPPFPATMTPVLAMWILEPFPYDQNQLGYATFKMPRDCEKVWSSDAPRTKQHCRDLQNGRRTYTLVVYYIDTAPTSFWAPESTWQGKARLVRYQLRKYKVANVASDANYDYLGINQGYVEPVGETNFARWPFKVGTATNENLQDTRAGGRPLRDIEGYLRVTDLVVVTDFIDTDTTIPSPACPEALPGTPDFVRTPLSAAAAPAGFFACVQDGGASFNAATFVYLRGNPEGLPGIRPQDVQNRPVITTTVLSRSVQGKVPKY